MGLKFAFFGGNRSPPTAGKERQGEDNSGGDGQKGRNWLAPPLPGKKTSLSTEEGGAAIGLEEGGRRARKLQKGEIDPVGPQW